MRKIILTVCLIPFLLNAQELTKLKLTDFADVTITTLDTLESKSYKDYVIFIPDTIELNDVKLLYDLMLDLFWWHFRSLKNEYEYEHYNKQLEISIDTSSVDTAFVKKYTKFLK